MTTINHDAMLPATDAINASAPAYAKFTRCLQATLYDSACVVCMVAVVLSLVAFGELFTGAGRVAAGAIFLLALLYEPFMVARFGGTLGHRRRNMRVIVDATGNSPGIVRALVRFVLKAALGLPSFIAMAVTARHQALHDKLTGTSVRIHDLASADESDYRLARPVLRPARRASRLRRALMVVGYIAAMTLFCIIMVALLVSSECLDGDLCGRVDAVIAGALPYCSMVGSVWAVIAGWQSRIPGTRARNRAIDATSQGTSAQVG